MNEEYEQGGPQGDLRIDCFVRCHGGNGETHWSDAAYHLMWEERDEAREALRKYGSHLPGCWHSAYHGCWSSSDRDPPCTCGFDKILKEIPK